MTAAPDLEGDKQAAVDAEDANLKTVRAYHERSKHHLERYARGPETLDWDNQPEPFRRFSGSPRVQLPYPALIEAETGKDAHGPTLEAVSTLLRHAFGLSAWKAFGPDRWSLRCNPSSGNLHPTEAYLICHGIDGLSEGVHHYAVQDHALEQRCAFSKPPGQAPELLVGLSSVHWREAWKYGERAYRYCQLDSGHALGALAYAAQLCGWSIELLACPDATISHLLGLDRKQDFAGVDQETPELLARVLIPGINTDQTITGDPPGQWPGDWPGNWQGNWQGLANPLGGEPRLSWPVIDEVAKACEQTDAGEPRASAASASASIDLQQRHKLAKTILTRRSAQAFDPKAVMPRKVFDELLFQSLPDASATPWNTWPEPARVHLIIFVHRVQDLPKGLYCLPRRRDAQSDLRDSLRNEFEWTRVENSTRELPLYRLIQADTRRAARTLSCHQEIASASAFSIAMLGEFDEALKPSDGQRDQPQAARPVGVGVRGGVRYRKLFQEAGLIGQSLYLNAEANGQRGTGIGCFFDDRVHETLGLTDSRYQSLYHFTVGSPKDDPRIQAHPPYEALARRQMATLKSQIATCFAERETLKAGLESGQLPSRATLRQLEELDAKLAGLDGRFKLLWDENGDR